MEKRTELFGTRQFTQALEEFFDRSDIRARMEAGSDAGKTAVEVVSDQILEEFGEIAKEDEVKKKMGRIVRQVMEKNGYKHYRSGCKVLTGNLFTKASKYRKHNGPLPSRGDEFARRAAAAEIALELCKVSRSMQPTGARHNAIIRELISTVVWKWTEAAGKYDGNPYRSIEAYRAMRLDNVEGDNALVHEHLVPRNVIVSMLLGIEEPTIGKIRSILEKFAIGVVVTKSEDSRLTTLGLRNTADVNNIWQRYVAAGIQLVDDPALPDSVRQDLREKGLLVQID